jgi:hypothetical protein
MARPAASRVLIEEIARREMQRSEALLRCVRVPTA